jgi:hypothetical protein
MRVKLKLMCGYSETDDVMSTLLHLKGGSLERGRVTTLVQNYCRKRRLKHQVEYRMHRLKDDIKMGFSQVDSEATF